MRKWQIVITGLSLFFVILIGGCQKKVTTVPQIGDEEPYETNESGEGDLVVEDKKDSNLLELESQDQTDAESAGAEQLAFANIYFEYDKYELAGEAREILAHHARLLKQYPNVKLLIEGHCDERGTIEYNLALGERRAMTVKKYLVNWGISPLRLSTISYGKERPLVPGHLPETWSKNRRAVFVITKR